MLRVEAVPVSRDFQGKLAIRVRRAGDASAMDLPPAGGDAGLFGCLRAREFITV
jgi:hypothetical protein